ncbi:STAS domain-containing protein [Pseudonocardia sichuanensis]|uniref:Anti-sigma factor antagonist n=1 Tax=Pseudonocardia kunmingensis TaxID=630975 RepID=A0A543CY43_9PSEU|nr:STAS domain-containing protein [Pseudonocardia kunmingensis]TQM02024.1 anti-sigma B factor antagonist [Pseudonocardia kunmingensis]
MGETVQPGPGVAGASASEFLDTTISRPEPATVLLSVRGEIDTLTAPAFTAATDELLAAPGETLVVDLSEVRFLASSGLAVLISAAHRAEERGLRLRLVVPTRAVRRPIEITGTGQLFDLHGDVAAATGGRD